MHSLKRKGTIIYQNVIDQKLVHINFVNYLIIKQQQPPKQPNNNQTKKQKQNKKEKKKFLGNAMFCKLRMFLGPLDNILFCWFVNPRYQIRPVNQLVYIIKNGYSTSDCIFMLYSLITKLLSDNQKLFCVLNDFRKALYTNASYMFMV